MTSAESEGKMCCWPKLGNRVYVRSFGDLDERELQPWLEPVIVELHARWKNARREKGALGRAQREVLGEHKEKPIGLKCGDGYRLTDDYKFDGYWPEHKTAMEIEWTCGSRILADLMKFEFCHKDGYEPPVKTGVLVTVMGHVVPPRPGDGGVAELSSLFRRRVTMCPVLLVNFCDEERIGFKRSGESGAANSD